MEGLLGDRRAVTSTVVGTSAKDHVRLSSWTRKVVQRNDNIYELVEYRLGENIATFVVDFAPVWWSRGRE